MFCPSWLNKFVITVAHALTVGPNGIIACVLLCEQPRPITVSIPFSEGLSQEVRRIARTTGVRCAFFTPNTLCSLYTSKDRLPTDSTTSAVYSVKCKTCSGEYVGETLRALLYERRNIAMRLDLDKAPSQPLPSMSMNS